MIKRYFLFLVLLLCACGSVSAYGTDTSDYKVVLDNTELTTAETTATLESYTWGGYTPNIVGVDGNVIYVASKSDLARFCGYLTYEAMNQPFSGYFQVYISDELSIPSVRVLRTDSKYASDNYMNVTTTKSVQDIYVWSSLHTSHSVAVAKTLIDDVIIYSISGGNAGWYYSYDTVTVGNSFKAEAYASDTDSGSEGALCDLVIVVFDNVDIEYNNLYGSLTDSYSQIAIEPMGPPDRGTVEIYTEPETAIYDGDVLVGTTDNGGYLALNLPIGDYDLKFVKEGYWDVLESVSIGIENEPELFFSLAPKSSIFQTSKEFSVNLYPNSVGTLSMDINPVKNAYAAKLRISGVDVNKVYYQTHEIPKAADGSYILGDVTSTQNIEIEFKTPQSWGEKAFTVEIAATDIEGTVYTNLETINYEVLELPFLLEMPETFGIGTNDITLTDQSGTAYSVLMVLYDSDDVEIWSSSTNLLEYCDHTFEVPVEDAGDYTLELNAKAGTVKIYYSIDIIEPVTLITDEITVNPGNVATVLFKISNPTSNVKYYTANLTGPFFNESIAKTFSIAPETVDKTVDISFEVPKGLELENYQLDLEIFDPDKTDAIYSGNIVLTISNESLLFASVPGGNTTIILLTAAVLLIAGMFAALRLKK
ncbi:hypothetical protein HNP92_001811 [Methanococcus maripaludis]|uniref:PEGA domain-containing protein n=1 Tax=Methanococcus maripaludis TaxID=39152 RepID=A0A7J9S7R3_METMI|nr:hypothetical protein [Methanococcus maripaludis]MBB6402489.1 hypothetical protein [Methanococcus maripaludis]